MSQKVGTYRKYHAVDRNTLPIIRTRVHSGISRECKIHSRNVEYCAYNLQPIGEFLLSLDILLDRWRLWFWTNDVEAFAEEYWVGCEMIDERGDMSLYLILGFENLKIQIIGCKPCRPSLRAGELRRAIA